MEFTDLVLIMGSKSLPNYVALTYFLQKNKQLKRIWIFCSDVESHYHIPRIPPKIPRMSA